MTDETSQHSKGEKHFRRLVDVLDHAVIWEFDDTRQTYTFVSQHSKLVLGYDCLEWMADPHFFENRLDPSDRPRFDEALRKVRAGEADDVRLEHRCVKSDGTTVWVHTGVHREDEDGTVFIRGVTIDINNIKLAEERERAAREQAELTTRAYEEIMAIVSHDLRNPLNSIVIGASMLTRDASQSARLAPRIVESAQQMSRLIDDLMDLSQIRTRQLKVTPTGVDVHELVRATMESFAALAAHRKISLVSQEEGGTATIQCDPKRISQVLGNLVGNALKFTPHDGGGEVIVASRLDELEAQFTVRDNGPGIAHADLPRVFDREWQAPETAAKGSGLGLYISKGIVEAHAGRIWAESIHGLGAAFHFTLPR
jgi:PAS domain S-box-containing protein